MDLTQLANLGEFVESFLCSMLATHRNGGRELQGFLSRDALVRLAGTFDPWTEGGPLVMDLTQLANLGAVFGEPQKNPSSWCCLSGTTARGIRSRCASRETTADFPILSRELSA